jgi:methionine biosynthesis protein MetW
MQRQHIKRETDLQIISTWIGHGQRVLDVGCGRGLFLEHLIRTRGAKVLGIDTSLDKVQACVRRGVPVYHGDAGACFSLFPDRHFDWVVLSRTIHELPCPGERIRDALRVADNLAVGFVNHGYWLNRWHAVVRGALPKNEVFPLSWEENRGSNPVTVCGFEAFAKEAGLHIANVVYLKGNWRTPTRFLPNLTAGYAVYHLTATPAVLYPPPAR